MTIDGLGFSGRFTQYSAGGDSSAQRSALSGADTAAKQGAFGADNTNSVQGTRDSSGSARSASGDANAQGDALQNAAGAGAAALQGVSRDGTKGQGAQKTQKGRFDKNECQTCKNRRYQDGSDDPGVSFKAPSKLSPEQAAGAVMSHEMEHVTRNQAKAREEGREVISQSVVLHNGICPECGKTYVAGGETRTVTAGKSKASKFDVGKENAGAQTGKNLDAVA